jgi:hypothetical protein
VKVAKVFPSKMIELLSIFVSSTFFKWTAICLIGVIAIYKYIQSKCNYWESQGVPTASVSFYTRFRRPIQIWEQELVRKNGKNFWNL